MRRLTKRGERVLRGAFALNVSLGLLILFGYAGGMEYADATHTEFNFASIVVILVPLSIHWVIMKIAKHYE